MRLFIELFSYTVLVLLFYAFFCLFRYYRRAAHPPARGIYGTIAFLRPLNLEDLEELLDHTAEAYLELNLSPKQFKEAQKARAARFMEHLGRMVHNSGFVADWARHQRIAALTLGDQEMHDACAELVRACMHTAAGVRDIQVAILTWRIKNAIFPLVKVPRLVPLASFGPFDLLSAYKHMADLAVTLCYDIEPEAEEALTLAL